MVTEAIETNVVGLCNALRTSEVLITDQAKLAAH